jgi:hypothetical protein
MLFSLWGDQLISQVRCGKKTRVFFPPNFAYSKDSTFIYLWTDGRTSFFHSMLNKDCDNHQSADDDDSSAADHHAHYDEHHWKDVTTSSQQQNMFLLLIAGLLVLLLHIVASISLATSYSGRVEG